MESLLAERVGFGREGGGEVKGEVENDLFVLA